MQKGSMLIYHGCRLGAAVAVCCVEIEGGDRVLAERAGVGGAAVHLFGCVISHIFIVVFLAVPALSNGCATLELGNARSVKGLCLQT
jgi:hypothetical protein